MEFRILGPIQVWNGPDRVALGGAQQARVLAALLLAPDRVVPLDALIDALWDGEPPPTARHQVHKVVAALRRRVPAPIDTDGPGYRLILERARLDATAFARAVGLGTTEALDEALALWRGPALAGIDGVRLRTAAAALDDSRLAAAERLADLRLSTGDAAAAVTVLAPLAEEHPLRESLRARLMTALDAAGRRADALALYARTRTLLADELGVDPGPELAALHRRLLSPPTAGKGPTRVEPVNTLPYDLPDFTGRAEDLRRVLEGTGVTAVDGMAGVGKTALVVHAAHRLAARYPDGQLFCDLHAHTPGTPPLRPEEALATLLTMLGVPAETIPDGLDARTARWRAALAGRRVLVVLDNAASAAQVRPLLPGTPGSRALVTGRRRLGAVEGATVCSLDVLAEEPALALLAAVAGPERVAAEPVAAAEVLRRCGYLPLAIRVAGTRLAQRPLWTVAEAARRLHTGRLGELSVHDRGVRPAFGLSYGCLDAAQRRMFRLLGTHPGADFDAWSAAALAGLARRRAEELLESLVDVHLLTQPAAGRYAFHDLIREYARGLVTPRPSLRGYFLAAAARAADLLSPDTRRVGPAPGGPPMSDVDDALAWLDAERATLLTYEGDWELACVLRPYFEHRGLFADWRRTHEQALRVTDDPTARALLRFGLGALEMWTGRLPEGMAHIRRALASDVDDPALEATALTSLGMLAHLGYRDAEAAAHLRRSIRISTSPRTTALALNNLGLTRGRVGERAAAVTLHRRALAMARDSGSVSAERAILLGFGETALRLGLPAAGHFRAARDLARAGRFRMQEALALDGLAHATGDGAAARQAWAIADELGVRTLHCEQCRVAPPVDAHHPASRERQEASR